jgi:hypothetical protein
MITTRDHGYTLLCSGCGAALTLTMRELRDPDRALDIKSAMQQEHRACDSYHDVAKARAAIKATRRAQRREPYRGGKR